MKADKMTIEKRLKNTILGDQDLKNLMEGIDSHRPPRIFLVGRTGVGKSSLINALCGSYVAKVSDTKSCTEGAEMYQCKDEGRVLMEILDTRGIAESESINSDVSASAMRWHRQGLRFRMNTREIRSKRFMKWCNTIRASS